MLSRLNMEIRNGNNLDVIKQTASSIYHHYAEYMACKTDPDDIIHVAGLPTQDFHDNLSHIFGDKPYNIKTRVELYVLLNEIDFIAEKIGGVVKRRIQ